MASGRAMERWWRAADEDPVHAAAAEWLVRLQDPALTLEESLEWQRWIDADEKHAHAFARLESTWDHPWRMLDSQLRKRQPSLRSGGWALAASAAVVAVAAAWVLGRDTSRSDDVELSSEVIRTSIGENRTLRLSDGSDITLGGRTELVVSMRERARRLELRHGEAFFVVAKDPARPFTVDTGDATVTAIGTEFNVRRSGDRIVVAVVEGRVAVAQEASAAPLAWLRRATEQPPAQLGAGDLLAFSGDGVEETAHLADPATSTAWRGGQLIFREEPLRYAVEDINRYSPKPIVVADEAIREIRISGTVLDQDVRGWLSSLESAFGLRAREESARIVLERAPGRP